MRKTLRKGLMALLALLFAVSVGLAVRTLWGYHVGAEAYNEAEALAGLPDLSALPTPSAPSDESADEPADTAQPEETAPPAPDPYAEALSRMDFSALREVNSEVFGWIYIPGTTISYPLVQGQDNDYYLNHTWKKTYGSVGAIFLECQNHADLSDFNTIVYGHRMNNNSMFGPLRRYQKQSFWEAHPYLYLTDDSGTHQYEIFAAYEASVSSVTYQLGFSGTTSKQAFLEECLSRSVLTTGITPTENDHILTLSTCTGNGHATRWVVQAVLPAPAEELPTEEAPPSSPPSADLPEADNAADAAASDTPDPADSPDSSDETSEPA